jgi:hypothetical protein
MGGLGGKLGRRRRLRISAAVSILVLCGSVLVPTVNAGHTMPKDVGGDCWRAGTPLWCRLSWATAPYHQVRLLFVDHFSSSGYSSFLTYVQNACDVWHNYKLPASNQPDILCHWATIGSDTYVHWYENSSLPTGVFGLTYNCNNADPPVCSASAGQSMNVWYSYVQFDVDNMNTSFGLDHTKRKFVMAHETGHTLGLYHHSDVLMHAGGTWPNPIPTGPTGTDYGQLPPCTGTYSSYGVRCVFNITN